jgi:hypothetical protein
VAKQFAIAFPFPFARGRVMYLQRTAYDYYSRL